MDPTIRRSSLLVLTLLVAASVAGCGYVRSTPADRSQADGSDDRRDPHFERLVTWMTGSFDSAAQAGRDDSFYDIRLEMWPIWQERRDAVWIYVEQAVAGREGSPYRQRVYRLRRVGEDLYESRVYTLPAEERFVGAWRGEAPLSDIDPDSLVEREGCSILLRPTEDGSFVGSTRGEDCPSDLRGASFATSEVRITAEGMDSWDRGFDEDGAQVWGSTEGPYEFRRRR